MKAPNDVAQIVERLLSVYRVEVEAMVPPPEQPGTEEVSRAFNRSIAVELAKIHERIDSMLPTLSVTEVVKNFAEHHERLVTLEKSKSNTMTVALNRVEELREQCAKEWYEIKKRFDQYDGMFEAEYKVRARGFAEMRERLAEQDKRLAEQDTHTAKVHQRTHGIVDRLDLLHQRLDEQDKRIAAFVNSDAADPGGCSVTENGIHVLEIIISKTTAERWRCVACGEVFNREMLRHASLADLKAWGVLP